MFCWNEFEVDFDVLWLIVGDIFDELLFFFLFGYDDCFIYFGIEDFGFILGDGNICDKFGIGKFFVIVNWIVG